MKEFSAKLLSVAFDYRYLAALVLFAAWLALAWIVMAVLTNLGRRLTAKTKTEADDIIFNELRIPFFGSLVLLGFWLISRFAPLPGRLAGGLAGSFQAIMVFLLVFAAARILVGLGKTYGSRSPAVAPMVPTLSRIVYLAVWGIGLLMVLDTLGISVTPLLATLGIGGLAVGLALQDTLANFFAGTYILISRPVRVGDYIRLESGEEGYVAGVGWRETRIRTLPGNIIVVPNQKLSQMVITNYYLPDREMACLVQVGVSYDSDLEKVERVTIETGREVLRKTTGGVKSFEPFIRYHTFADFSVNFTVILRVSEFVDKYLVTHEFIKALHKRYQQEEIEIPFPIRSVYLNRSKEGSKL